MHVYGWLLWFLVVDSMLSMLNGQGKSLQIKFVYGWSMSLWSTCSTTCGLGVEERTLQGCIDDTGQTVDDGVLPLPGLWMEIAGIDLIGKCISEVPPISRTCSNRYDCPVATM